MELFYITKYALSGGIFSIHSRAEHEDFMRPGQEWVHDTRPNNWAHYYVGRDAFRTEAEAVADADKRRKDKIESLRKQIAKLEGLQFGGADA